MTALEQAARDIDTYLGVAGDAAPIGGVIVPLRLLCALREALRSIRGEPNELRKL